jgi:dienelactone hydrolase
MNFEAVVCMRRMVLIAAILCCAVLPARADVLDSGLREAVHSVSVGDTGASIVVTSFRPRGAGPFQWIVLSHGTGSAQANRAIGRYRRLHIAREWVSRGYAVLVPVRRGYGASGGELFGDSYGSCARADFHRAGEGAALDVLATVDWARGQADLDRTRWLLVGQSAGGFASIYAASRKPEGLVAVLAFAPGRGGDPQRRPGEPCASERMAELFASIGGQIAVPVLWFYAENDEFFGPRVQKLWFESFRLAGGRGELIVAAPFRQRGHGLFAQPAGAPIWTAAVERFFRSQRLAASF